MKKLIFISIIILTITFKTKGQGNNEVFDKAVAKYKELLVSKGILKIGSTEETCVGVISSRKNCVYDRASRKLYLFWNDGTGNFIKKFDNCGEYNELKITDEFFSFYELNESVINKEKVKPYQENIFGGIVSSDHSCRKEIIITKSGKEILWNFDYFDLYEKKAGNSFQSNVNYKRNSKLKLVEWDAKIEELIKNLNQEGLFKLKASNG